MRVVWASYEDVFVLHFLPLTAATSSTLFVLQFSFFFFPSTFMKLFALSSTPFFSTFFSRYSCCFYSSV